MNALITGGSSGLGNKIAEKLLSELSGNIYFTYNTGEAAAMALASTNNRFKPLKCNFESEAQLADLIDNIPQMEIDVLVNNAYARPVAKPFIKFTEEDFLVDFKQNVLPTLEITRAVFQTMRERKKGQIISILSTYLFDPPMGMSVYASGKSYLLSMTRSWAKEGQKFNIVATAVSPSFMLTPMTSDTDERIVEQIAEAHPLGRLTNVEEVAEEVAYLVKTRNHSGENVIIDGHQQQR